MAMAAAPLRGLVAVIVALAGGARAADTGAPPPLRPTTAVVSVLSPPELAGAFVGRFPAAVADLPKELSAVVPAVDDKGCAKYAMGPAGDFVAVVNGTSSCTVAQQASLARAAGLQGLVVVSSSEAIDSLWVAEGGAGDAEGAFVVGVKKSMGDAVLAWAKTHEQEAQGGGLRMSFAEYKPPGLLDASQLLLVSLATGLVAAGAFFSTADLRLGSPIAPKAEEVVEMDKWFPLVFCAMGSTALVVLYFLMKYLIYAIIFMFCVGGTSSLTELMHRCMRYRFPSLQRRLCSLPMVGAVETAVVIAFPIAASVAVAWLVLRNTSHGWIFQDIIGAAFLCFIQRTLRLPSIKLASALLTIMFFFDIFWVFISPLFFEQSVMVVVATGGGTGEQVPMLLRMPAIGDPLGRDRMLGFGDIALPGLLVSFLRRHDVLSHRALGRGYFAPALVGYFVAMCVTLVALEIMKMGQPALLYLVPGTLGTTLVLAWRRRELNALWEGVPCSSAEGARPGGPLCHYCPGGHTLKPAPAEKGRCDGCRKQVDAGEPVMDCRLCNWYLCSACRPVNAPAPATVEVQDLERSLVTS